MLTRSQKKRTIGKDESCPQNSNLTQLFSAIPTDNPVKKVGEMVTMNHGESSQRRSDDDGHTTDYLQVAWLLREKLNDLVDDDNKGNLRPRLGELRGLLDMTASNSIISVDPKMLNPVLWRTLPKELLLHVFARLPVPEIIRLRNLSCEWRRDLTTVNSDIIQVCHEARPILVAGVSRKNRKLEDGLPDTEYLVTICDLSTPRSPYLYCLRPGMNDPSSQWIDMGALDGGLICFVSAWRPCKANPLCIVVVNLLTQVRRQLPPLQYAYSTPPQMMHIEVDSKTKCYRVVVICKNRKGHLSVEIDDSSARQWTKATSSHGFIFGLTYTWQYSNVSKKFRGRYPTQSVYDFAEGQFKSCDGKSHALGGASVMTIWKDSKFVLHKNTNNGKFSRGGGYHIIKYRLQTNAQDWVEERSYLCSPLEDMLKRVSWSSLWTLKACEYPLLMISYFSRFWVLDLSTGKWSGCLNGFEVDKPRISMGWAFGNVGP